MRPKASTLERIDHSKCAKVTNGISIGDTIVSCVLDREVDIEVTTAAIAIGKRSYIEREQEAKAGRNAAGIRVPSCTLNPI